MKKRVSKLLLTAGVVAACVCGMAGCSSEEPTESSTGLTGGVAATVNGVEIAEDDVTLSVESVRTSYGIVDEASWADWMYTYEYTSESVRSEVIDGFIEQELVRQGAANAGIVVEESELDMYVNSLKSQFEDEEAWAVALQGAGFEDEAAYREVIKDSLIVERFEETFTTTEEPAEEDMLMYAQMYAASFDGAKRSSHILFDSSDEATAQEVLDKINSGELDFAEAASQYSLDGSKDSGGDVGWDALSSFVTEYQTALDGLETGQVSGLVVSQFGIHIIKCTETYVAPEEMTTLDGLPQEFYDIIYDMLYEQLCAAEYEEWLNEQLETADIVINEMPAGLSYYVDMEAYSAQRAAEEEAAAAEEAAAEGGDAAAEGAEGAAAEAEGAAVEGAEGAAAEADTAEQPAAE